MTTYLVLNGIFLLTLLIFKPKKWSRPSKIWWLTLVSIVVLTAVFDPIVIALHIYAYDPSRLLGVYWFGAPIEDFFYALYAVAIVPLVWHRLEECHRG